MHGSGGNDTVLGDDEGDHIYGGCGHDSLAGFDGDDTVSGGAGNDSVQGGTGNDSLTGDSGDDVLFGSVGTDTLAGGTGADLFVFTCGGAVDHYDSGLTPSQRDVVADFTPGDDLIRLVESTLAPIKLIGSADFTGENQVRWVSKGGSTTLYINGDSDLAADMAIVLTGVTPLNAVVFQLA